MQLLQVLYNIQFAAIFSSTLL